MYRWGPVLLLSALFAMPSTGSKAAPQIGVAATVRPSAEGVVADNSQTLAAGTELYSNETVRTGNRGLADLVFIDKTDLSVGPASEVLLDKFVYDPKGSSGKVVLQATRGAFRFVTGEQDHRAYQVNTPFGSLGVRGTVVEVVTVPREEREKARCVTKVRLVSGRATFTTFTGQVARLNEPDTVVCVTPTGSVEYSTSSRSILSFNAVPPPPPPIVNPPGGLGPSLPPPPCVSPTTLNCGG
jgi:hypothetical protein